MPHQRIQAFRRRGQNREKGGGFSQLGLDFHIGIVFNRRRESFSRSNGEGREAGRVGAKAGLVRGFPASLFSRR